MNILVNATAAKTGGALNILNLLLEDAKNDEYNNYIFFITTKNIKDPKVKNVKLIIIKEQSIITRIIWDLYLLNRICKKKGINPNIAISLQNTGFRINNNAKKIIYIHQRIPFEKSIHIPFRQKKLWFYRYIYGVLMKITIKKDDILVVQTESMKNAVIRQYTNVIYVIPPQVTICAKEIKKKHDKDIFSIIYPGLYQYYKNHMIILEALCILVSQNPTIKMKFICNLNSDNKKEFDFVEKNNLTNYVEFLGIVNYETICDLYNKCDLMVFPSSIETFGLPLLEAASYGLPIIAADLDYSHDVLKNYKNVKYVKYDDPEEWAIEIMKFYSQKNNISKTPIILEINKDYNNLVELIHNL